MTWLADLELETIVVNTKAGSSFKGIKDAVYDDCVVLREVHHLDGGANVITKLEGNMVIPRENVDSIQTLTGNGG